MSGRLRRARQEEALERRIAGSRSSREARRCRAELAAYWARVGRFDEARAALADLRRCNAAQPEAELSVRLHFGEGLLAYFESVGSRRSDGVQRAHALSRAAGLEALRALCAAWLAQWSLSTLDLDALVRFVREALAASDASQHASRCRANLVVAQALHLAGRLDLATPWYRRTREHAAAAQDDATIGAIMHNMTLQRMLLLRQAVLTGRHAAGSDAARQVLASADSAAAYDQMKGDVGWREWKLMMRAQVVSLQGHAADALALYAELDASRVDRDRRSNLFADQAWCHAERGHAAEAQSLALQAEQSLAPGVRIDDEAAVHSRLAQVFVLVGAEPQARAHASRAGAAWSRFASMQQRAVELLGDLDAEIE